MVLNNGLALATDLLIKGSLMTVLININIIDKYCTQNKLLKIEEIDCSRCCQDYV